MLNHRSYPSFYERFILHSRSSSPYPLAPLCSFLLTLFGSHIRLFLCSCSAQNSASARFPLRFRRIANCLGLASKICIGCALAARLRSPRRLLVLLALGLTERSLAGAAVARTSGAGLDWIGGGLGVLNWSIIRCTILGLR